jgi:hypothetical protein
MSDESDALTIAKFVGYLTPERFDPELHDNVRDAERVLIERGYGDKYGQALCGEVLGLEGAHPDNVYLPTMADATKLATSPLDARVRAMAAVIRSAGLSFTITGSGYAEGERP